jgi:hypothetical protein
MDKMFSIWRFFSLFDIFIFVSLTYKYLSALSSSMRIYCLVKSILMPQIYGRLNPELPLMNLFTANRNLHTDNGSLCTDNTFLLADWPSLHKFTGNVINLCSKMLFILHVFYIFTIGIFLKSR